MTGQLTIESIFKFLTARLRHSRTQKTETVTQNPKTMVCIACLLPLFLVPIVNLLPLLFDYIMGKVYGLLGWEYRKPERASLACPYKPPARNNSPTNMVGAEGGLGVQVPDSKPVRVAEGKQD